MRSTDTSGRQLLLVERNRLWRDGLTRILEDSGYQVAASADTLETGLQAAGSAGVVPDIVLLDSACIETDGTQEFATVRQHFPDSRVVVFTDPECPRKALSCFLAGADGCLVKDISSAAMAGCLKLVMLGERVFPSTLIAALLSEPALGRPPPEVPSLDVELADPKATRLSQREREILACLAAGRSNKEIALAIDLTEATVKVHLRNILRKIRANNRTQAAIWAIKHGLADHPSPR